METLDLNDDELKALGKKLGAGVKTEEELVNLTKTLRKAMIEVTWSSFLVHKVKRFLQSICSSFKLVWTPVPQIRM